MVVLDGFMAAQGRDCTAGQRKDRRMWVCRDTRDGRIKKKGEMLLKILQYNGFSGMINRELSKAYQKGI